MDDAVVAGNLDLLMLMLFWLGLAYLLSSGSAMLQTRLFAGMSASLVGSLRQRMYDKVQSMHDGEADSAAIATHFGADLGAVEKWLSQPARVTLIHASVLMTSASLLFWVEWRLALFTYCMIPVIVLAMKFIAKPGMQNNSLKKEEDGRIASFISEEVRSHTMIRLFGLGERRRQQFGQQGERMHQLEHNTAFWSSLTGEVSIILINLIQVGVFGLGAFLTIKGTITLGSLIAFVGLMINISNAGITLSQLLPQLFDAVAAYRRIRQLLGLPQAAVAAQGDAQLAPLQSIDLEGLGFAYQAGLPVLRDISLHIRQGERIALVGSSGSGKSTLLRVLMGLERHQTGVLAFNGIPIERIREKALHQQMAAVFQQPLLLDCSIRENIRAGNPLASDEAVRQAARLAEIDTLVGSMASGYDTLVGESGGKLSGGQQQRIAIARALIRDPDLLMLDEATSALDAATEQALIDTLQRVTRGRTVIAVTHRLALAVAMDRIIVLDQGQIVEDGDHASLLAQNGRYASLWQKQSLGQDGGGEDAGIAPEYLLQLSPLAHLQLPQYLDESALQDLCKRFVRERFQPGAEVIRQHRPADAFRIISRGTAEVLRSTDTAAGAQVQRLALLEAGDYFGEGALLSGGLTMATIRACTPLSCLGLSTADFNAIVQRSPGLRERLAEHFAQRMAENAA
jgi:ATP-binding cassette subfamily B protein